MKNAIVLSLLTAIAVIGIAPTAQARHRVTEVNRRLEDQSFRVQSGTGKHKMNVNQQMRADDADYRIAAQEQTMRTKHQGRLTKRDQRILNRELNHNSRRIRHDKDN